MMKCGIAGIGHLGRALTQQLEEIGVQVGAYHPTAHRRDEFASNFKEVQAVNFSELLNQPIVLLALPAEVIQTFLRKAQEEISTGDIQPTFVNLSSLVNTKELQNEFPYLQIYGVKMVGHADYLYEYGDGVFLTETSLDTEGFEKVHSIFDKIGRLFEDNEDVVRKVNGLAIKNIIQACATFEEETKDYPSDYREKAMDTIFPNTMRLYREGSFDGFMLKVMDEMNLKHTK